MNDTTKTLKYIGSAGVQDLTIDIFKLNDSVVTAIDELRKQYCILGDLKILISPLIEKFAAMKYWEDNQEFIRTGTPGKITHWYGIEVSDEYPFNDHILIFHKTLGAFRPELVRRVNL